MSTRAHVVVLVVTLVSAAFILRMVNTRQLRSKFGLLWTLIAAALVPLAVFPGLIERLSRTVGIYYPPTAFLLFAVGFLFLVLVTYSWELSRMETRVRRLAEELALLRTEIHLGVPAPRAGDGRPGHAAD